MVDVYYQNDIGVVNGLHGGGGEIYPNKTMV